MKERVFEAKIIVAEIIRELVKEQNLNRPVLTLHEKANKPYRCLPSKKHFANSCFSYFNTPFLAFGANPIILNTSFSLSKPYTSQS